MDKDNTAKSNIPEEKLYTEKIVKKLQTENERIKGICAKYKMANREWAINYEKLQDRYTKLLELTIQQEQKRIITNYEKIKQMSIDEMAEFIYQIETGQICDCGHCPHYTECNDFMDKGKNYWQLCKDYQKQWLQQESEG